MENEEKIVAIVLIVVAIILAIFLVKLIQDRPEKIDIYSTHSHTKAICDSTNYCQDYYIECNGKAIVSMNPITGAAIQFDNGWTDPRNDSEINEFC